MNAARFVARFPQLYHMAEGGSWESILRHGLLSTSRLLDLFEVSGPEREAIEFQRRLAKVDIHHLAHDTVTIRDQKPLYEPGLRRSLVGMEVVEWYHMLSRMVFFWPRWADLLRMANSPEYRSDVRLVLTVDTHRLMQAAGERLRLSSINSGYARRNPALRGPATFTALDDYPGSDVKEIAVLNGVAGAADLIETASELLPDGTWRPVWPS